MGPITTNRVIRIQVRSGTSKYVVAIKVRNKGYSNANPMDDAVMGEDKRIEIGDFLV